MLLHLKSGGFVFEDSNPMQLSCEFIRWSVLNLQHLTCTPIQREAVGGVWSMLSTEEGVSSILRMLQVHKRTAARPKEILPLLRGYHFLKRVAANLVSKADLKFHKRENWNGRKKSWGLMTYGLEHSKADSLWVKCWLCRWPAVWSGVRFLGPKLHPPHLKKVIARRMTWKVMKIASPSAQHTMRTQFMLISYIIYYIIW